LEEQPILFRWKFAVAVSVILMILSLYPQIRLWQSRGYDYQGAYAYNDLDEVAYAAYVKALIDGRPRRNDPYTGRDHTPETPQPESLFSIQFIPPYIIALPSRLLGLTASTAMVWTAALAAFLTGLALFWSITSITGDDRLGAVGALIVMGFGTLAAGEGAIGEIFYNGISYPFFPAWRRYIPAIAFPVFFIYCGSIWRMITSEDRIVRAFFCFLASVCFAILLFSYFYIWTTAAALFCCLILVWLIFRPEGWWNDLVAFLFLGLIMANSLIPYFLLLSNRSPDMDHVQLLIQTRMPDFFRLPTIIGYSIFGLFVFFWLLGLFKFKRRNTLFIISLAAVTFVVFNQQILTGKLLQPIHYQVFIVNYVAAFAAVITLDWLWKNITFNWMPGFLLVVLGIAATVWGGVEAYYTARVSDEVNIFRDEGMPVARRLTELSATDTPSPGSQRAVVLSFNHNQADDLPTLIPQAVLWARHLHVFTGSNWEEHKERFYQMIYYANWDEKSLESDIMGGDFVTIIALFGWGRHGDRLNPAFKPLTVGEVKEEVQNFARFRQNFGYQQASHPTLSYVVVHTEAETDFTNIDKWYERDEGEQFGKFKLYRVKLKQPPQ
jgi:hypothetical protein